MSEYDALLEGFDSSLPVEDPGPLSEAETKKLEEVFGLDEPPHDPDDWPEEAFGLPVVVEPEVNEDVAVVTDLRALKPDQIPAVGSHYVIFNGVPRPVIRGNYQISEDEHVRTQLVGMEDLKDADGQRRVRADRTARLRYRGYLCGEMTSL